MSAIFSWKGGGSGRGRGGGEGEEGGRGEEGDGFHNDCQFFDPY